LRWGEKCRCWPAEKRFKVHFIGIFCLKHFFAC
jgi:hypothetical protein